MQSITMTDQRETLLHHFPELQPVQLDQLISLQPLYEDWNSKINVISRKDMDRFFEHHLLHSLGIARIMDFQPGARVLDIGTGGGFPGIPLAIFFPDVQFHLVDAIGKKIRVVEAVKQAVGLSNVTAEHVRAEALKQSYDYVVSRAVTRMERFLPWVKGKVKHGMNGSLPNGLFFLKGGDLAEELGETGLFFDVHDLSLHFKSEFFETKKVIYLSRDELLDYR